MFQNGGVNSGIFPSTFSAFLQPDVCQMSAKIVINEVIFYNFTLLSSVFTEVLTGSVNAVFTRVNTTKPWISPRLLVIPQGLEPQTASLEGRCSIQLSYETSSFSQTISFKRVQRCTILYEIQLQLLKTILTNKHKKEPPIMEALDK